VRDDLQLIPVSSMDEVLKIALSGVADGVPKIALTGGTDNVPKVKPLLP